MAKELPYFKFIATEWLTGSIAMESMELQGLFINICALYWKNGGVLSKKEIEIRYKKKKVLEIIFSRYIIVENEMIKIQFLNEQLTERQYVSDKNRDNVLKRWEGKKEEVVIRNDTTVQIGITKPYNIEEEREEEKKEKRKEQELPNGSYQEFLKIYSDWYESRVGVKILFDGMQGKALKKIVTYLIANSTGKDAQGGADAWSYILLNWHKLEPFYQEQIKVNQIQSNLPNILNQLKNGNSKTKPSNSQNNIHSAIDAMLGQ